MPRKERADEAGSICHALNRGNARQTILHKDEDYQAFLHVLGEGLERYPVELFSFTLTRSGIRCARIWSGGRKIGVTVRCLFLFPALALAGQRDVNHVVNCPR